MPDGEPTPQRASTIAWRSRDFRFYSYSRLLGTAGAEAQAVGVAWQVFQLTHSALALGYTRLALFPPGIFFVFPAGHVADIVDRRRVVLACYTIQLLTNLALLALTLRGMS